MLKNKKVAVLGMGIEGLAIANFLVEKVNKIVLLDRMEQEEIEKGLEGEQKKIFYSLVTQSNVDKIFGEKYLDSLTEYDIVFRTPGISFLNKKIQEAADKGVEISSQIKLFFDLCPCKIIGITGTKGKGTTSSLIFEILRKKYKNSETNVYIAGNIGYPAITLIKNLTREDIVILELSSFQLMDLHTSPSIAVITNLSVDHLDYHANIEEYQNSKFNILRYQNENDTAILNFDSTYDGKKINSLKSKILYFSKSSEKDCFVRKSKEYYEVILIKDCRQKKICNENEIKLLGRHNLENIAAATLAADSLGIDPDVIASTAKEFRGLPHRLELIKDIDGVRYINDSFATNPDPTMAAIKSFSEDLILILGGSSKGADFSELAQTTVNSTVKTVILIGDEAPKIKKALEDKKFQGKIMENLFDMNEIVESAKENSSPKNIVLLSPACASFGMFKNYKDRGERFREAVLNLDNLKA